ncbi:E3 ubiquitin-protein ligase COP1 [Platanthera zijinensis]|uniref:E3 ubiquitin-protein ligase COP1 n=1 Tax=Platanthera zijinensis TaxID=2320716 RepID=A0AAP0B802_9ASPA
MGIRFQFTACGHSFCYMCIVTHLQNKSDCPCCSNYLTKNLLYTGIHIFLAFLND